MHAAHCAVGERAWRKAVDVEDRAFAGQGQEAETGGPLGGEMSGHIFFKDRWYGFDDGLYAGARLLELLSRVDDPSAVLNALPQSSSTPELHLKLAEGENVALIDKLQRDARFPGARQIITI